MKHFLVLTFAFFFLFSSCVLNRSVKTRSITVTGTGEVVVPVTKASLSLSVVTKNPDVQKASEENAVKIKAVEEALAAIGISREKITTANYNIYQENNFQQAKNIQELYVVSNHLNVSVPNTDMAGKAIDAAIKAGANQLTSIDFIADENEDALKQARILAIRNAEQKATTYVTTAGCTLGKLLTVSEEIGSRPFPRNHALMAAKTSMDESTSVYSGKSIVSVSLTVEYEIKN